MESTKVQTFGAVFMCNGEIARERSLARMPELNYVVDGFLYSFGLVQCKHTLLEALTTITFSRSMHVVRMRVSRRKIAA